MKRFSNINPQLCWNVRFYVSKKSVSFYTCLTSMVTPMTWDYQIYTLETHFYMLDLWLKHDETPDLQISHLLFYVTFFVMPCSPACWRVHYSLLRNSENNPTKGYYVTKVTHTHGPYGCHRESCNDIGNNPACYSPRSWRRKNKCSIILVLFKDTENKM